MFLLMMSPTLSQSSVVTVNYPVSIAYRAVPNMAGVQPASEVTLFNGAQSTAAVAVFDSGSLYTVFSPEYAQLIGIEDVTVGNRQGINTLAGQRDIYLFDMDIQLRETGPRFGAQIGFFAGHSARNILGRSVVFAAFEIGFRESEQVLHLRSET
jgi:hypothetical protein